MTRITGVLYHDPCHMLLLPKMSYHVISSKKTQRAKKHDKERKKEQARKKRISCFMSFPRACRT